MRRTKTNNSMKTIDKILWQLGKGARLQFWYLTTRKDVRALSAIFVLISSTISMVVMGTAAYFTSWTLIFPSLGPTTFLIFYAPSRPMSSPRNCVIGHLLGALIGTAFFFLLIWIYPDAITTKGLSIPAIITVAISMGITGMIMTLTDLLHPPAASTAMIAAMGIHATQWYDLPTLLLALGLLILQAIVMHRLAGIEYPLWAPKDTQESPCIRTKLGDINTQHIHSPDMATDINEFYSQMAKKITSRQYNEDNLEDNNTTGHNESSSQFDFDKLYEKLASKDKKTD